MKPRLAFHSSAVWPPLGLVAVFAVGLWVIARATGNLGGQISAMLEIINIRAGILGTAAGLFALYRLGRFHPACNLGYAAWLRSSPWTPDKRLPLGPVHIVWQDGAVIGVLAGLAQWHAHVDPALPVIVFGLAYLVAMTFLLAFTRTWMPCLCLGFLWPALSLPAARGLPTFGIFGAIMLVIWYGHRKSLRAFPWRRGGSRAADSLRPDRAKSWLEVEIRIPVLNCAPAVQTPNLGWPFQWLSPKVDNTPVSASTSIALSTLFGWWTYCAIVSLEMPSAPAALLVFAVIAALTRLGIYCSGLVPSFNLWGRFASGRIIVPGFDRVWVTPLMVIALATAGGVVVRHAGQWYPSVTACIVALLWFALLRGSPTLRAWVLTGQHRYRFPARLATGKQLLRPI
ncbi:MAG: hypothetical protein NT154_09685 [Verrucomicrobia bacterium]|nr:hypothetical protein [Verrucomicrobiota bacterium]